MSLRDRPLLTDMIDEAGLFRPRSGASYVYGTSGEARSRHLTAWRNATRQIKFVAVSEITDNIFNFFWNDANRKVSLRAASQLKSFWKNCSSGLAYLDITGLPHHIWAPVLRAGLTHTESLCVVYAEPAEYRFHPSPTPGQIFDLSERINGVAPIPGFASLTDERDQESFVFVPTLGFEGTRLAHMIEQVQPGDMVIPIVGVPGFRPEYPFYTFHGNQLPFHDTAIWKKVRFASANCPFSLYYTLEEIRDVHDGDRLKIAPIGTKPHALGAILFAITNEDTVELVYDHPIRKPTRTEGSARILIYHVSDFIGL